MASQLADVMNPVPVKNRVTDHDVTIHFAGEFWVWKPGEVKHLPLKLADWMEEHSQFAWRPADLALDIPASSKTRLVVLDRGTDESDISWVSTVRMENIDREAMEPVIDPADGEAFKTQYVDTRGMSPGVLGARAQRADSRAAREQFETTRRIEAEATERLADLAAEAVPARPGE
jgi:hypothetical protein